MSVQTVYRRIATRATAIDHLTFVPRIGNGLTTPCVSALISVFRLTLVRAILTIRGGAVTVVGIVVVQRAVRVHKTHVVRVPRVRGALNYPQHSAMLTIINPRYLF